MYVTSQSNCFVFLISWLIYLLQLGQQSYAAIPCNVANPFLKTCGENATCEQVTGNNGVCKCLDRFYLVGDKCVFQPVSPTDMISDNEHDLINSGRSLTMWILIPCFIVIFIGAVIFMVKRLRLIEKLYQFRVRRYNTVFVTSMQDDDAPIS